ncbi:hypothetical protein [Hydrogenispora ethanolica]|uniref:hypothetical protein n=1 Tax=Hydrogenispora ethanolica TaxID=1082276 RepID=UPI0010505D76|nr:hypothetical protein [Hydrogenispora ethanolica]
MKKLEIFARKGQKFQQKESNLRLMELISLPFLSFLYQNYILERIFSQVQWKESENPQSYFLKNCGDKNGRGRLLPEANVLFLSLRNYHSHFIIEYEIFFGKGYHDVG